jgi:hypothetical protein
MSFHPVPVTDDEAVLMAQQSAAALSDIIDVTHIPTVLGALPALPLLRQQKLLRVLEFTPVRLFS